MRDTPVTFTIALEIPFAMDRHAHHNIWGSVAIKFSWYFKRLDSRSTCAIFVNVYWFDLSIFTKGFTPNQRGMLRERERGERERAECDFKFKVNV